MPPADSGEGDCTDVVASGAGVDAPHCVRRLLALSDAAVGEGDAPVTACLWDYGALRFDMSARRVLRGERDIGVTAREFAILLHLAWARGRPVGKERLYRAAFGLRFVPETNALAVHVYRLRRKIDHGAAVPLLRTIEGRGYALIREV